MPLNKMTHYTVSVIINDSLYSTKIVTTKRTWVVFFPEVYFILGKKGLDLTINKIYTLSTL